MKKIMISVFALLLIIFVSNQNSTFAQDFEFDYEPDSYKPNQLI